MKEQQTEIKMFFYSEKSAPSAHPVDVWKMNANTAYMNHFDNYLFLSFMLEKGTDAEKRQSAIEMTICERKMEFWERHHSFNSDIVKSLKEKKIREWRGRA
jgi:hypothetical protein